MPSDEVSRSFDRQGRPFDNRSTRDTAPRPPIEDGQPHSKRQAKAPRTRVRPDRPDQHFYARLIEAETPVPPQPSQNPRPAAVPDPDHRAG